MAIRGAQSHIAPPESTLWYNKIGLGFWRVPDIGVAGSIAVTLKALRVAGAAHLEYPLTGSITLPMLSVHGELRYGPDDSPGRVTLKALTVSGSLTVKAPSTVTHALFYKYNARSGGPIATWQKSYSGSRQVQIKRSIPSGATMQEFDIALSASTTVALTMYSTQDVSVVLNDDHIQTISLLARRPITWTSDSTAAFPFTEDVVKLFVSNPGIADARFIISALILDHAN